MHFERDGLAGKRVVEVEQQRLVPQLAHHARITALPVRARELHHVAHRINLVRVAQLAQQRQLHALQQLGVAVAEGFARGQLETLVRTLGQADKARLDGGRQLAGAQRQRRRLVVEGVDDVGAVRAREPVMQREEGAGLDGVHSKEVGERLARLPILCR